MLANLLAESGYPKYIGFGEVAIDAIIGFIVVCIGIALLIGVVWLVGRVMQSIDGTAATKTPKEEKKTQPVPQVKTETTDEPSEETIAVITAAIAAYYERENRQCEFTVKRIKKI